VDLEAVRTFAAVADRAATSVRPGRRALRIDVLNRRTAPATPLHAFHQLHSGVDLDVVTLSDVHADSFVGSNPTAVGYS
jgi:hypothetical protein